MNKTLQIGLVSIYILLTGIAFLFTLAMSGVYISWPTLLLTLTAWTFFCFLSVRFRGPLDLFFHGRLRPPILEEENRLNSCFTEVLQNAGSQKKFRLRILETKEENAIACNNNIIAVSRSLLNMLTDDELKGILAHELGHLLSHDTTITWAFVTAGDLPRTVRRACYITVFLIRRALRWTLIILFLWQLLVIALAAVIIWIFFFKPLWLMPLIAIVLFLALFFLLDKLFRWWRLILSRQCEYKQDAYAQELGYGAGLRDALKKMAQYGREQVNTYFTLMNGTQPIIYNRIRRLEKLEGMRDSF